MSEKLLIMASEKFRKGRNASRRGDSDTAWACINDSSDAVRKLEQFGFRAGIPRYVKQKTR